MADGYYVGGLASGDNDGSSWANAWRTIAGAIAATGAGDTIWASSAGSESAADIVLTSTGQRIISINAAGSTPPVEADMLAGATFLGADDVLFNTATAPLYMWGCTIQAGDDVASGGQLGVFLDTCTIIVTGSGDRLVCNQGLIHLHNCAWTPASGGFIMTGVGNFIMTGGSVGTVTNVQATFGSLTGQSHYDGVDISLASTLIYVSGTAAPSQARFKGCLLKAGYAIRGGTSAMGKGQLIGLYGSHSSNVPYFIHELMAEGNIITETTIIKTGGSSDGTTPISLKFETSATALEYYSPLRNDLPILFYIAETGNTTFSVDVLTDGVTLQDDEAWLEISGQGDTIKHTLADSLPATIMTTPSNIPTNADEWTTTGLSAPVKQTLSVTINIQQVGWVEAHICLAKPSITMYADLKVLDGARQYLAGQAYINGEASTGGGGAGGYPKGAINNA